MFRSLGVTLVEMLTGTHPWPNLILNEHFVYKLINLKENEMPEFLLKNGITEDLKSFLKLTFTVDYVKRPSSKMLLKHAFLLNDNECTKVQEKIKRNLKNIFND